MIAYKGFNEDLTCTLGKGKFKYEIGKTYKEEKAQCINAGFHCVEEPLEVLSWYPNGRYCMVDAGGDIHEDGSDRISCTKMKILKEVTLEQLAALECEWIIQHPDRKECFRIRKNTGTAKENGIVIVRGKNPKAAGEKGATIFLLKEGKGTKEIAEAGAYKIDGKEFLPDVFYKADGRRARCIKAS